ncbi:MarR family winged helix-turn-helix transcriptional regulator [Streptomyces oceani]|uniref:MarR family transcriptional regulator n=1 Tax=Streptomyces oceani TaxID=1075402 RepID=A0A1E7JWI6_9ACTN|nr:MarR family winged helix-turn-helix transcriptional regulator [Streptomyces oceani]OEU96017.1 MarR family transcriptional regulator [Streptomyces oceani]
MSAERAEHRELARQLRSVVAVNRELGRHLPNECPPASAGVLALLRKYGELRMSELTELLGIDMSVTSRHVAHVAERGWIERHPDPRDGRSRLLRLTESGDQQLDELSERTVDVLEHQLADWSEADVAQLSSLLDRLRESFCPTHIPTPRH